jgi:hypothetical protein
MKELLCNECEGDAAWTFFLFDYDVFPDFNFSPYCNPKTKTLNQWRYAICIIIYMKYLTPLPSSLPIYSEISLHRSSCRKIHRLHFPSHFLQMFGPLQDLYDCFGDCISRLISLIKIRRFVIFSTSLRFQNFQSCPSSFKKLLLEKLRKTYIINTFCKLKNIRSNSNFEFQWKPTIHLKYTRRLIRFFYLPRK